MSKAPLPSAIAIALALLASQIANPTLLRAQKGADAEIVHATLVRNSGLLQASFRLDNALDDELLARIESGLPTTLTYQVRLERPRKWWFDRNLARSELQVIAMYNAVTREYLVNFKQDGSLIDSRVVQNREALERTMTQIDRMSLARFDSDGAEPGEGEQQQGQEPVVRIRAALGSKNWLGMIPTTVHTPWSTVALSEATSLPPTEQDARTSTVL